MNMYRHRARTQRGGAKSAVLLVLGIVALGGLGYSMLGREAPKTTSPLHQAEQKAEPGQMSEVERSAYVKAHVRVAGIEVTPDTDPDGNPVPGLLRVSGQVSNDGERGVHKVVFTMLPKDADGEILSAHVADLAKKGGELKPSEVRDFAFTIPDKKAFEGAFDYDLR